MPSPFRPILPGLLLACLALSAASAQEPLKEEAGFLRIKIGGRDVRLEALIVRPENSAGRLPLALIAHGKSISGLGMAELHAVGYAPVARDMARRGWLAAVAMRRGFGQSDGPFPAVSSCGKSDLREAFASDADELDGILQSLKDRPDVDGQRVVALGESAGGAAVMAWAGRKPPGLRAVVNVAGGLNLPDCVEKGRDALVETVKLWQTPGSVPQLWVYARNDELFPPELVDRMLKAARDAGGDVRFVELPEMKPQGHLIFVNSRARFVWEREMDTSLRAWALPTWAPERARTAYAAFGLNGGVDSFERYFSAPGEKALAFSRSVGKFGYWYGADTLSSARDNAVRECAKAAGDCVIAFENDRPLVTP